MLYVFGKDAELYTSTGIDPLWLLPFDLVLFSMYSYTGERNTGKQLPLSSVPVSQPVHLGYFRSLSHLEISYIPIQSIQDLLKMRERLETLVVTNCFSANFQLQVFIVYTCLHMCVFLCVCVCV